MNRCDSKGGVRKSHLFKKCNEYFYFIIFFFQPENTACQNAEHTAGISLKKNGPKQSKTFLMSDATKSKSTTLKCNIENVNSHPTPFRRGPFIWVVSEHFQIVPAFYGTVWTHNKCF